MRTVLVLAAAALLGGCSEVKPSTPKARTDAPRLLTASDRAAIGQAAKDACFCRRRATTEAAKEACGAELRRLTAGLASNPGPWADCVPFSYGATSACYDQPGGKEFCTASVHFGEFELCTPEEEQAIAAVWSMENQHAAELIIEALKRGEEVRPPRGAGGCAG